MWLIYWRSIRIAITGFFFARFFFAFKTIAIIWFASMKKRRIAISVIDLDANQKHFVLIIVFFFSLSLVLLLKHTQSMRYEQLLITSVCFVCHFFLLNIIAISFPLIILFLFVAAMMIPYDFLVANCAWSIQRFQGAKKRERERHFTVALHSCLQMLTHLDTIPFIHRPRLWWRSWKRGSKSTVLHLSSWMQWIFRCNFPNPNGWNVFIIMQTADQGSLSTFSERSKKIPAIAHTNYNHLTAETALYYNCV